MEEWRIVAEFPNYEVSNTGKVRNIDTKKELTGHILNNGYHQVGLYSNKRPYYRMVHCLVAIAFIGNKPYGMEVNHKDGDKLNNDVANLEYITHSKNMIHAHLVLDNPGKKLNKHIAKDIRIALRQGQNRTDIAKAYGISKSTVQLIAHQQLWEDESGVIPNPKQKLTPDKVVEIRKRANNGETHTKIARSYGVSSSTIDFVVNGKLWKSVDFPQKG